MYAIFCIHPNTLSITIKSFHETYKIALENLRYETEDYIRKTKGQIDVRYIIKKGELNKNNDGYFLKMSNKYPNRVSIYEKTTKLDAGIFVTSEVIAIKKVMVFSLIEMSNYPQSLEYEEQAKPVTKVVETTNYVGQLDYLEELKTYLEKRRKSIIGHD